MKYKYFTDKEVKGLENVLVAKLDYARGLAGFPFYITSGYRSPDSNSKVGGVKNSAHTAGLAVDLKAPIGKDEREKMIWALGVAGFERIGVYDRHFHVDIDMSKPWPAYWTGKSK